jgi:hypothetical protein
MLNFLSSDKRPVDTYIRKGRPGGYQEEMPQGYIEKFDAWFAESETLKQGFTN